MADEKDKKYSPEEELHDEKNISFEDEQLEIDDFELLPAEFDFQEEDKPKVLVIADEPIKAILEKAFEDISIDYNDNLSRSSIVQVELGRSKSSFQGFDEALKINNKQIFLLGFGDELSYADDMRWHALRGKGARLIQLPLSLEKTTRCVSRPYYEQQPADPLAEKLVDIKQESNTLKTLKHDLPHVLAGHKDKEEFLSLARNLFGDQSEDEILRLIEQTESIEGQKPFAGESFPDLCVDFDGTLYQDNEFNPLILRLLNQFSNVRPVTIWTGGDLKSTREKIRKAGIACKLVQKEILTDAKVGVAIDDLSSEEFAALGLLAEKFVNINDLAKEMEESKVLIGESQKEVYPLEILTEPYGVRPGDELWSTNNNYGLRVIGVDAEGRLWAEKTSEVVGENEDGTMIFGDISGDYWCFESVDRFQDDCGCDGIINVRERKEKQLER